MIHTVRPRDSWGGALSHIGNAASRLKIPGHRCWRRAVLISVPQRRPGAAVWPSYKRWLRARRARQSGRPDSGTTASHIPRVSGHRVWSRGCGSSIKGGAPTADHLWNDEDATCVSRRGLCVPPRPGRALVRGSHQTADLLRRCWDHMPDGPHECTAGRSRRWASPTGGLVWAVWSNRRGVAVAMLMVAVAVYGGWAVLNDAAVHGWYRSERAPPSFELQAVARIGGPELPVGIHHRALSARPSDAAAVSATNVHRTPRRDLETALSTRSGTGG